MSTYPPTSSPINVGPSSPPLDSYLLIVVCVLALTFWPATARLARADALAVRERQFVKATRAFGAGHIRIVLRHLLPSALPAVVVTASFQAGAAVLIEGGLAFLGLGDPSVVSWGKMLADAQSYLQGAWWMALFPGAAMTLTIVALNLIGDGIGEVADVRGRRSIRLKASMAGTVGLPTRATSTEA